MLLIKQCLFFFGLVMQRAMKRWIPSANSKASLDERGPLTYDLVFRLPSRFA